MHLVSEGDPCWIRDIWSYDGHNDRSRIDVYDRSDAIRRDPPPHGLGCDPQVPS